MRKNLNFLIIALFVILAALAISGVAYAEDMEDIDEDMFVGGANSGHVYFLAIPLPGDTVKSIESIQDKKILTNLNGMPHGGSVKVDKNRGNGLHITIVMFGTKKPNISLLKQAIQVELKKEIRDPAYASQYNIRESLTTATYDTFSVKKGKDYGYMVYRINKPRGLTFLAKKLHGILSSSKYSSLGVDSRMDFPKKGHISIGMYYGGTSMYSFLVQRFLAAQAVKGRPNGSHVLLPAPSCSNDYYINKMNLMVQGSDGKYMIVDTFYF